MDDIPRLAYTLQGEAGICGFWAMVAISYVVTTGRNTTFYGWQNPGEMAVYVAQNYFYYPDPTPDARYVFSRSDLQKPAVQRIIENRGPPLQVFRCKGGLELHFFA